METTHLVEAMIAAALAAITVCAIVAAYFSWVQGRQHVIIEAFESVQGDLAGAPAFTLTVTLCNRRRSSIQPLYLEIKGLPKAGISCADGLPKHARQPPHEASFPYLPIPPFETREATFDIAFDWQGARAAAPAAGGDLRWQAVVTFNNRRRGGRRWSQQLDLAFHGADLHRLTATGSPALERRGPRRPFSGS